MVFGLQQFNDSENDKLKLKSKRNKKMIHLLEKRYKIRGYKSVDLHTKREFKFVGN